MKLEIYLDTWKRKAHYDFFSKFSEPFFGVCVNVDMTQAVQHAALKAANESENFRYRTSEGRVFLHDQVHASATINRPDETFGFGYFDYTDKESEFYQRALVEIEQVRNIQGLVPSGSGDNAIHFTAIPWIPFTAISHARNFSYADSCPKISFGKFVQEKKRVLMPVSVHVHHGLADGYHVGLFLDRFQQLLDQE